MTPAVVARIIEKFGGPTKLGAEIERDQSTISHWKRKGIIPAREQPRILDAARRMGIDLTPNDFFDLPQIAPSTEAAQ